MSERLLGCRVAAVTNRIGRALPLCVSIALVGCAGVPRSAVSPTVVLTSLQMLGPSVDGQRFSLTLRITNPNPEPLTVVEISYSVRLAGEGYLNGRSGSPVELPSGEPTIVHIESESAAVSSGSRLLALTQGPQSTLPFELSGALVVSVRPPRSMPFRSSGNVPLSIATN